MGILDKFKSKKEQEISGKTGGSGSAGKGLAAERDAKARVTETDVKAEKPKAAKKKAVKSVPADLSGIIVRPLVTEKAAVVAHVGQYSFVVSSTANRVAIRSAIKAMYGVLPVSVNIQCVRGKSVRFGRSIGRRSSWKKAIVTLPKGKTIDVYEGV